MLLKIVAILSQLVIFCYQSDHFMLFQVTALCLLGKNLSITWMIKDHVRRLNIKTHLICEGDSRYPKKMSLNTVNRNSGGRVDGDCTIDLLTWFVDSLIRRDVDHSPHAGMMSPKAHNDLV